MDKTGRECQERIILLTPVDQQEGQKLASVTVGLGLGEPGTLVRGPVAWTRIIRIHDLSPKEAT